MSADLLTRGLLVVAAAVAAAAGGPVWLRTLLALLAAAAVAHRLVVRSPRDRLLAVAVTGGGALVALVLVGLAMGLVGVPLGRTSWAVALGTLGLAALATSAGTLEAAERPTAPRPRLADLLPAAAAALLLITSLVVAVRSSEGVTSTPLQLSITRLEPTSADVEVTSTQVAGPFELRLSTAEGTRTTAVPAVSAGSPADLTVDLPETGRVVITLNNIGQDEALRSLVVDR